MVDNVFQGRRRLIQVCLRVNIRNAFLEVRTRLALDHDYVVVSFMFVIRLTPISRFFSYGQVNFVRAFGDSLLVLVEFLEGHFLPICVEHGQVAVLVFDGRMDLITAVDEVDRAYAGSEVARVDRGLLVF